MRSFVLLFIVTAWISGCATTGSHRTHGSVRGVIETATSLLGVERLRHQGKSYRSDCSGFVTAAYDATGVQLIRPGVDGVSATQMIFQTLKERGHLRSDSKLRPGDLVFFHNTWDRNKNRLRDDPFSHIGIVDSVKADGTTSFFHYASGRVKRSTMNLRHRNEARDPESGKTWNSTLRRGGGRVLAGQLFYRAGHPLSP